MMPWLTLADKESEKKQVKSLAFYFNQIKKEPKEKSLGSFGKEKI